MSIFNILLLIVFFLIIKAQLKRSSTPVNASTVFTQGKNNITGIANKLSSPGGLF